MRNQGTVGKETFKFKMELTQSPNFILFWKIDDLEEWTDEG